VEDVFQLEVDARFLEPTMFGQVIGEEVDAAVGAGLSGIKAGSVPVGEQHVVEAYIGLAVAEGGDHAHGLGGLLACFQGVVGMGDQGVPVRAGREAGGEE